ncbi:MAG TPA: 50S ribosomal protein L25/general stress protein Ctc, partial [Actinomycetes bacterium]|nr:50S ribosomal protein L25/general stress protein Ctc [Actinomycetes bacterium]
MSEVRLKAEQRTEFGKGAARRIRRANLVPAVVYGHGTQPRHVSLPGHALMMALKTSNVLLELDIDGEGRELTLPKHVQRDPIRGYLEHVDLVVVRRGEKVTVDVPLHIVGEVASGGLLNSEMNTLSVEAEATTIPAQLDIDVTDMAIGTSVHAGDVKLPEGTTLAIDPETPVLNVMAAPTAEQIEAELAEAEADAGIEHEAPTTSEPAAEAPPAAA